MWIEAMNAAPAIGLVVMIMFFGCALYQASQILILMHATRTSMNGYFDAVGERLDGMEGRLRELERRNQDARDLREGR